MKRLLSIALIAALIVSGTPLMGITLGSNNNGFAYAANTIPIDEEHFPDDYFRNQLTGWYGSSFDPATVTTLRMGYFNIASFEGLQYFTALETLDCSGNKLSSLDVSHNTKLKQLNCGSNSLVSLDVSHNTELETLQCFINKLSSLDVSHNKKLKNLYCDSNNLKSLDVSHNTVLETLHCECNELSSLDLSNNIRLNGLSCYRNKLSSLDISNTNLTNLQCENNNLSSLDVSHNTDLRDLNCSENNLSNLDVSHNTALTSLTCSNNKLSSLDISHNTALESFSCDNNNLGKLYVYDKLPKYSSYDDGVEIIYVEGHDDIDKGYITFHYISSASDDEGTAKVYYDNNYFTLSNDEYSHGLATASLGLSMAGFKREYVADFLKDCGFRNNIEQSDRYYTPLTNDEDKVAYTFATKEIDGDTVIAVVLRGGNYGNEWGSDGRVGHLQNVYGYHYAFNAAADDIINHLETYCDDNGIELYSIATKIWLTGYSRGAAVANCVGAKLEKNNLINKDNLYCYGLATPRTVTGEKVYKSAQGIYNVVNPLDVVPCVPLNSSTLVTIKTKSNILTTVQKPWNYTRHGETLELPSALMNLGYISQLNDMSKEFYEITGTAYLRFKGVLLQSLLDILATSTVSEKNYVVYIQDQFIVPALEKFMGEGITDDAALLSVLSTIPGTRKMLEEAGFIQKISGNTKRSVKSGGTENPIMMQHWPETYLSWMNTSVPKKPGFIKSIFVQCPVDVKVYNSDNNLLTQIIDDEVDESIEGHLESYVDKAGMKVISMPAEGEYRVEITATDEGEMDYSVAEYDENLITQRIVTYENIKLEEGQEFTGVVNEEINTSADNYNLTTEGTVIEADHDYSGDEIGNIQIEVDVTGDGVVTGNGAYTAGDSVVLEAFADDNCTFNGWYEDDVLVSADNVFTFKADTSKTYVASFTEAPEDPCKNGHTFGPWSTIKEATASSAGQKSHTCTVCGFTEIQEIAPAASASPSEIVDLPAVKISKPKAAKKSATIKWKKVSSKNQKKISKIQIQYSMDKTFKTGVKTTTAKKSATNKKIKKLKSKKTYYFRIRAYKNVGGKVHVSKWSKAKPVKIK